MAECSYSRCMQRRRHIKRQLQRWTKNMVYIVGLERIAEELMGRRKWKLYQKSMSRNYLQPLNNNIKTRTNEHQKINHQQQQQQQEQQFEENYDRQRDDFAEDTSSEQVVEKLKEISSIGVKEDIEEREQEEQQQQQLLFKREEVVEERLKDWTPQSKCYFCVDGKLDSEHNNHGVLSPRHSDTDSSDSPSDTEAPPTLTPSSGGALINNIINNNINNNNNHHHYLHIPRYLKNMTTIESVTSVAALTAVAFSANNSNSPTPSLPFFPPNIMQNNWYLANVARSIQAERMEVEKSSGEQPLDLSSKGGSNNNNNNNNNNNSNLNTEKQLPPNIRLPTLDNKQIFNSDFRAKPRMSTVAGRRTYTEDELQAALRDIQSGKLGTRRAAVIYGIPRSTLRNKVYKLALERERESHLNTSTPLKIDEEEVDDDKELSGAEEEKEVEKALQQPLLSVADLLRFSRIENVDAVKQLIQSRTRESQDLHGVEPNLIAPYIQNLLLTSGGLVPGVKPTENEINAMIPELMKRMMAEEQSFKDHIKLNNGDVTIPRPSPSNSVASQKDKCKSESDMETDETPSNVILKIPSFKPTTSKNGCDMYKPSMDGSLVSPPVTSDSSSPPILPGKSMSLKDVKEVIAKSISQKFQQSPEPPRLPVDIDFKRSGFTPPLGAISVIKPQQEMNRQYPPAPPQHKNPQNSNQANQAGGKGTRPKRGKYRNYDRDSLVEAVRAVQRGEMSVHRAGSYYGVPHSTLEYKVKERHLMRPRKRDPKPNPVDEKIASLKQNDLRNSAEKLKPAAKQPQKFPPTSPNGMKMPMFEPTSLGYSAAPFPFWTHPNFPQFPMEYGRTATATFAANPDYFASQMVQKMQEERGHTNATPTTPNSALPKSARQIAESLLEGPGANGSFLDGIIRSSLESGVPVSEDKSPKEEKNVAPENMSNKALLDQLCRNSRLTPLTKPNLIETNSCSGDESFRKSSSPINFATGNSKDGSSMSGIGGSRDSSPPPPQPSSHSQHDIHTIELPDDSNDGSSSATTGTSTITTTIQPPLLGAASATSSTMNKKEDVKMLTTATTTTIAPGRIYLKQELTNPENLKPEMLVRYRDVLHDVERNGVVETAAGSASESDAVQD